MIQTYNSDNFFLSEFWHFCWILKFFQLRYKQQELDFKKSQNCEIQIRQNLELLFESLSNASLYPTIMTL